MSSSPSLNLMRILLTKGIVLTVFQRIPLSFFLESDPGFIYDVPWVPEDIFS